MGSSSSRQLLKDLKRTELVSPDGIFRPRTRKKCETLLAKYDTNSSKTLERQQALVYLGEVYDTVEYACGSSTPKADVLELWFDYFDRNHDGVFQLWEFQASLSNLLRDPLGPEAAKSLPGVNLMLGIKNDVRNHIKTNLQDYKFVASADLIALPLPLSRKPSVEVTKLDGGQAALVRQLATELQGEGWEVPEPVLLELVRQFSLKHVSSEHKRPNPPSTEEDAKRLEAEQEKRLIECDDAKRALVRQTSARAQLVRRTSLGDQRSNQKDAYEAEDRKECGICRCKDGEVDEDELEPVRVLKLQCSHFYCTECLTQQLLSKWPGLRLTFG